MVNFYLPNGVGIVGVRATDFPELPRWLLKFSGGSIDDYATFFALFPTKPSC